MIFHLSLTLVIKNDIIWKYLTTNVMEFSFLDMTTSVFSSARDKDLKSFS